MFGKTIPTQPTPPTDLPNYLAEGVLKQDGETLRSLQTWVGELLDYRQYVATDEIQEDADKAMETVEETGGGSVVEKED